MSENDELSEVELSESDSRLDLVQPNDFKICNLCMLIHRITAVVQYTKGIQCREQEDLYPGCRPHLHLLLSDQDPQMDHQVQGKRIKY